MPIAADHALPLPAGVGAPARRLDPNHLGDHLDRLYRAAWALCGSREDAEDLVQDTYTRVLQKPRFIRSEEDLGYLLRVLRNTYFSRLRTAARRPRAEPFPEEIDRLEDRNATTPETALNAAELYAQIAALPEPFREALVAIDVAGLSYGEAARALRVREATITTRLHRARKQVAERLAQPPPSDRDRRARASSEGTTSGPPDSVRARMTGPEGNKPGGVFSGGGTP
jgi:RNA polymerase sigma-70 factor, ECF subfamily